MINKANITQRAVPLLAMLLALSLVGAANAKPYPRHKVANIVALKESAGQTGIQINYPLLDAMLTDLTVNINPAPVHFDSPSDKALAVAEINQLIVMLQKIQYGAGDLKLMRRSTYALQLADALGVEGASEEVHTLYGAMIAKFPQQADIQLQYGLLLMQQAKYSKAEFYFDRAAKLGLGEGYLMSIMAANAQGHKTQAKQKLANFKKMSPQDPRIAMLEAQLK